LHTAGQSLAALHPFSICRLQCVQCAKCCAVLCCAVLCCRIVLIVVGVVFLALIAYAVYRRRREFQRASLLAYVSASPVTSAGDAVAGGGAYSRVMTEEPGLHLSDPALHGAEPALELSHSHCDVRDSMMSVGSRESFGQDSQIYMSAASLPAGARGEVDSKSDHSVPAPDRMPRAVPEPLAPPPAAAAAASAIDIAPAS
jgi:hypothetical protein